MSHLAMIQSAKSSTTDDDYIELIGLITIEDIIEEILQSEIVDETDVVVADDVHSSRRRNETQAFIKTSGWKK